MKGKDTMKAAIWMLAFLMGCVALSHAANSKSPAVLFQEALYQEETEGDLDKAMDLYKQVIEQAADVERVAARAVYQLGLCHLKKGEKEQAATYFRQVVRQYPKQAAVNSKAQKQLNKIAPANDIISQSYVIHYKTINSSEEGLKLFNQKHPKGVRTHHANRYRKNGEQINSICTDTQEGTDKIVEMLRQHPQLEFIKVVPPVSQAGKQVIFTDGFEKGDNTPDGWVKGQSVDGVHYIWDRKNGSDGNSSLCLKKTAQTYFPIAQWTRKVAHTGNAKKLSVSAKVRARGAYKAVIDALFLDGSGQWIKHEWVYYIGAREKGDPPTNHNWLNCSGSVEIPDSTKTIVIGLQMYGPGTVWFDEVEAAYITDNRDNTEFAYKLNQTVSVNISHSPNNSKLSVQYAVMAIAKAAGVPYQWEKSQKLAGTKARQYIQPVNFENTPATEALIEILEAVGLSYSVDEAGIFLSDTAAIVEKAVLTISTCAETDPRIKTAMESLKKLDETAVVNEIVKHLDSDENTVRRSAIYVLWQGGFSTIDPTVKKLEALCSHSEDLTRGMAALALGQNKVSSSFDSLRKMTQDDASSYARRCAAYGLGLLGNPKAKPVLEKAVNDPDKLVRSNANAALKMLELETPPVAENPAKADEMKAESLAAEGWTLWRQRKLPEAEAKFKEAVRNNPVNENAWQGLGWAQLNQGKKKNAEDSFKKCVKLNPKNSAALNGLGWIAHGQSDKDTAIKWWEKAVKASGGHATASLNGLTQTYMEMKEYDKAVKYYKMWLKVEPNNQDAKAGLKKAKAQMN